MVELYKINRVFTRDIRKVANIFQKLLLHLAPYLYDFKKLIG